jgi:hypothetical protein
MNVNRSSDRSERVRTVLAIRSLLACAIAMLLSSAAIAQDGYRLLADGIVVTTQAHWQSWSAPDGVRVVDTEGVVTPRFLRREINAVLNADQFQYVSEGDTLTGGIVGLGTGPVETAPLTMDGDDETWW